MKPRPEDRWLDSSLEEILGGKTPPDLSDVILERLAARRDQAAGKAPDPSPLPQVVVAAPPATIRLRRRRSRRKLPRVAVALAGCVVVGLIATWWSTGGREPSSPPNEPEGVASAELAPLTAPESASPSTTEELDPAGAPDPASMELAAEFPFGGSEAVLDAESDAANALPPPRSDQAIVAEIDQNFTQLWAQAGLTIRPVAGEQWLERACQAILGRAATRDDRERWNSPAVGRSPEAFVDLLLGPAYHDQLADYWAQRLAMRLLPQGGAQQAMLAKRLRGELADSAAYDRMLVELITANGSDDPEQADFNPAVAFLVADNDPDRHELTARTARGMLGLRLDCARCHDDQVSGLPQRAYWELNAFFRGMIAQKGEDGHWQVSPHPEGVPIDDVFYRRPDETLAVAYPRLLDRPLQGLPSGWPDATRRQQLALELAASGEMSRAAIDWMWQEIFQRPLTSLPPGSSQAPTGDALVALLADQWRAGGYRWKRPLRWILLSRPFAAPAAEPATARSAIQHFARFVPERAAMDPQRSLHLLATMSGPSAQQVDIAASILSMADNGDQPPARQPEDKQAVVQWLREKPGRDRLSPGQRTFLRQLAEARLSPEERINHVFTYFLGRLPSQSEREAARDLTGSGSGNPATLEMIAAVLADGPPSTP